MNARIVKDNTLPLTWKRVITPEHKYIVIQSSNTKSISSEIYHSDDCTLNNRVFLFEITGGIEKVKLAIGNYEFEQTQIEADNKKINEFIGLESEQ